MSAPTPEQEATLRHMLGITDAYVREPKAYRNYAAVNPGDPHYAAMAEAGLVILRDSTKNVGGRYDVYSCTELGRKVAFESFKKIRKPKAKRVYTRYLRLTDSHPDLKFREYLTDPRYAQHRREA